MLGKFFNVKTWGWTYFISSFCYNPRAKQFSKIITDFETAFLSTAFPTSASRPAPASARPALRPLIGLSGLPSNQFITNDGQACRCLSRVTTTHHPQHTVPKVIVFPRYNTKCGGGNEKLHFLYISRYTSEIWITFLYSTFHWVIIPFNHFPSHTDFCGNFQANIVKRNDLWS